jgi:hypothetical protein
MQLYTFIAFTCLTPCRRRVKQVQRTTQCLLIKHQGVVHFAVQNGRMPPISCMHVMLKALIKLILHGLYVFPLPRVSYLVNW